jgi:hypothetical protein
MTISIKKFGQISSVHIPPSLRRKVHELSADEDPSRIYTEIGEAKYLILSFSVDDYSWTFYTWTQIVVGDETTIAANAAEAEFIRNIHSLQTRYELNYIESPETYHYVSDELPRYAADEDEDDDLYDGPSDGGEE